MHEIAWYMEAWFLLQELVAMLGKSTEATWNLVLESTMHGIGLWLPSSARRDTLGKGYTVMKSFADHTLACIPSSCFRDLRGSGTATHMSLTDTFRSFQNTFYRGEALQGDQTQHFWNAIVNNGSEREDLHRL